MISWIQRTFEQHFKTLFLVLLGGVIISFVFTIGAMPSSTQGGRHVQKREFFGVNLNSREEAERVFGDAQLSIALQAGYNALEGARLQQYALVRHAGIAIADQLGLAAPDDKAIAAYVQTLRMFQGDDGKFDPKRYQEFRDSLRTNPRMTEADVSRVITSDVIYRQVTELLGGPGYVMPSDVAEQLTATDSTWSIEVANVDTSAFTPEIKLSESDIAAFFADNSGRYEIPAQTRVDFVAFPFDVTTVNVTDQELLSTYLANPARFPSPDAKEGDDKASAFDNFAKVKPQVEAAVRRQKAARVAGQAASDFALALFEGKVSVEALPAFLQTRGLTLKSAGPISADSTPKELAGVSQLASAASRLDATHPYSDALVGSDKAVVLVWRESIAARVPAIAEVRAKVESDLRESRKHALLAEAGKKLRDDLAARLKTGAKFADAAPAAAKAAGLAADTKTFSGFTLTTPPEGLDYTTINALQPLSTGDLSPLVTASRDKALVIHVIEKKLPDLTAATPRYKEVKDRLSGILSSRGGEDALSAIVAQEMARNAPTAP